MVKAKETVKPAAPVTGGTPAPAAPIAAPVVDASAKPKKEKVAKEKSKKRSDFGPGPNDPNGWVAWCEYKKQRYLAKAKKNQDTANQWEANKAGEEVAKNEKKVKKLQATLKKVEAARAELKAMGIDLKAAGLE